LGIRDRGIHEMNWLVTTIFLWAASACAQPAIAPPQVGFEQDGVGSLRPVYGLAGNFILGPSITDQVVSEGFSGSLGLLKTDSSLVAFDSQGNVLASAGASLFHARGGPALFAFSPDGSTALAFFASSNTLIEWRGGQFTPIPLQPEELGADTVLAISLPNAREVCLIIQKTSGIWEVSLPLVRARPYAQRALIGVTAPLLPLASGGLLYHDDGGIVLRRADGSEVHVAAQLPASFSLQQMDREWVQLTDLASPARFAIHVTPAHEGFYQLPESSQ
jgi:hypothetical protein